MRRTFIFYMVCAAVVLVLSACGTSKPTVSNSDGTVGFAPNVFLQQVSTAPERLPQTITSKLKFSAQIGAKDVSVGGQLRMKRDEVIRIQLMALGIVEAGRLEFTPDYVLLMDRINKQYVKANYSDLDFLRQSGISFYTLQALFWNQLFQPGHQKPQLTDFKADRTATDTVVIRLPQPIERLSYQWKADAKTARIQSASVDHSEAQLLWEYGNFKSIDQQTFPATMQVCVSTPAKQVKVGLQLSNLSSDDDWETRTSISSKYKKVDVDDILRRLMSL